MNYPPYKPEWFSSTKTPTHDLVHRTPAPYTSPITPEIAKENFPWLMFAKTESEIKSLEKDFVLIEVFGDNGRSNSELAVDPRRLSAFLQTEIEEQAKLIKRD